MCTSLQIKSRDGVVVHGRTNEFEAEYNSEIVFIPRGYKLNSSIFMKNDFTHETKYSFLGINAPGMINEGEFFLDGLSENGISISLHYNHYHQYKEMAMEDVTEDKLNIVLLNGWILGNITSVQELRDRAEEINEMVYWPKGLSQAGLGARFIVMDKTGDNIVIETENEKLNLKENPLAVMTNGSPLEYHYENMRYFSSLRSEKITPTPLKGLPNHALRTTGNGLNGLPGDFTANSRFVRAAIFSSFVETPETGIDAVTEAFRILMTSEIVNGVMTTKMTPEELAKTIELFPSTIVSKDHERTVGDITDNTLAKDMTNLKLFYRDFKTIAPRVIDLAAIKDSSEKMSIPMRNDGSIKYQEVELQK